MIKLDKVKRLIKYPNTFTFTNNKNIQNLLPTVPIYHPPHTNSHLLHSHNHSNTLYYNNFRSRTINTYLLHPPQTNSHLLHSHNHSTTLYYNNFRSRTINTHLLHPPLTTSFNLCIKTTTTSEPLPPL